MDVSLASKHKIKKKPQTSALPLTNETDNQVEYAAINHHKHVTVTQGTEKNASYGIHGCIMYGLT